MCIRDRLFALGLVYPFALPVAYGTMGGYVLWRLEFRRSGSWRALAAALVAAAIPGPFLLYYLNTFFFDPFWKGTHVVQLVIPTPPLWWLAAGYGLPLVWAVWGLLPTRETWRRRPSASITGDTAWTLLAVWGLVNGVLLYLPVAFNWRLANGFHFVLALLAARGLEERVLPWLRRRGGYRALRRWSPFPEQTWRRMLLALTVPSTLVVALLTARIALTERGFPYYVPRAQLRAMDWLAQRVDWDDVVLGGYPTGNVLPTRSLCRVVVGHQFFTLDPGEKLEDVIRFFAAETPDEARRAILEQYDVTVVYYGPWERELGSGLMDRDDPSYLREIYRDEETTIYRVVSPVAGGG